MLNVKKLKKKKYAWFKECSAVKKVAWHGSVSACHIKMPQLLLRNEFHCYLLSGDARIQFVTVWLCRWSALQYANFNGIIKLFLLPCIISICSICNTKPIRRHSGHLMLLRLKEWTRQLSILSLCVFICKRIPIIFILPGHSKDVSVEETENSVCR